MSTLHHCGTPDASRVAPNVLAPKRAVPVTFTDGSCDLALVERRGEFVVYHRTHGTRCRGFELVRLRNHAARQTHFGYVDSRQSFPMANGWGKDGVSIRDREEALDRLGESVRIGSLASAARLAKEGRTR